MLKLKTHNDQDYFQHPSVYTTYIQVSRHPVHFTLSLNNKSQRPL